MTRKFGLVVLSLAIVSFTGGCASGTSIFNPASNNAQVTSQLTLLVFGIAAVVFVVVEGILVYTYLRFSQKKQNKTDLPNQTEGNRRLELGWTAVPALVLAGVYAFSIGPLGIVSYQPGLFTGDPASNVVNVRAVGHQWFWEFDYPDDHIVTANELHIPVGVPVKLDLESTDVIHSFWVPELGGKMDVIPGHTNTLWIQADKAGTYAGQCAEFCGVEHAKMRLLVIAEPADQFKTWVQQQQAPIQAALSGDSANGEQIFLAGTCIGCHTVDGTKAKGLVGPNLTHFASRQTFAGSTLPNDPKNLADWLSDPQAVKPGNLMPNLHLSDRDIQQLVAYLESLK